MGIEAVRGKTGKGIDIEMDRERHQWHSELVNIRMALIFDYRPQAIRRKSYVQSKIPIHQI